MKIEPYDGAKFKEEPSGMRKVLDAMNVPRECLRLKTAKEYREFTLLKGVAAGSFHIYVEGGDVIVWKYDKYPTRGNDIGPDQSAPVLSPTEI